MWGNNSPWPLLLRALTPLPLLADRREVPGELLQPCGKQTCISNSTCHEEAEWPFERQALEIKGSDDWVEIRPCLLSDGFLRQRPSSVNHLHVCVTVIIAVLNINVKGY